MMKSRELKLSWKNTKEILKQEFDELYDSDSLLLQVKQNRILGKIQSKLGKTEEEIKSIIAK